MFVINALILNILEFLHSKILSGLSVCVVPQGGFAFVFFFIPNDVTTI